MTTDLLGLSEDEVRRLLAATIVESDLSLSFDPALHPRDPGGEGGGQFIRKGIAALHDLFRTVEGDDDPAFSDAVDGLNELIGSISVPGGEAIPMGQVPRDQMPDDFRASEAVYLIDDQTGKPIGIVLVEESEGPRSLFVVHEIGHHLDHSLLLGHGGHMNEYASDRGEGSFAALAREMEATAHVQSLIDAPNIVDEVHQVQIASWVGYLLQPQELFARAFEQWAALRSGNAEWIRAIDESLEEALTLKANLDGRWPWAEFADLATILDMIFERRGMLRPGAAGRDPAGVMRRA